MADVGWPFYGLDDRMQPDISAAGYFDGLSAMVGIDLMEIYAAAQLSGVSGDGDDDAASRLDAEKIADGEWSSSVPLSGFEPDGAEISRHQLSFPGGDDGEVPQRVSVSAGGLDLWMDTLSAAEDAGADGFGWDYAGIGVPGSSDGQDTGQTARQFALYTGADGWLQQSMGLPAGLSALESDIPFTGPPTGSEPAASASGVSPGEAIDAAAAGALWQKAALADSFSAFSGTAPHSQAAAQNPVLRTGGISGLDGASGMDTLLSPEMLWSDAEDRLLDRLERRLGIEIANSTEGAFG